MYRWCFYRNAFLKQGIWDLRAERYLFIGIVIHQDLPYIHQKEKEL